MSEDYELRQRQRDREWRTAWADPKMERIERAMVTRPVTGKLTFKVDCLRVPDDDREALLTELTAVFAKHGCPGALTQEDARGEAYPVQIDRSKKRFGRPLLETSHADADDQARMSVGRDEDVEQTAESHPLFHSSTDMAEVCDRYEDLLRERHDLDEETATAIAQEVRMIVKRAEMEKNSETASRIAGFMILGDANPLAKAHGLILAIPDMASLNGITSVSHSSRICKKAGVRATTEDICKLRNRWCEILGIPVPAAGAKSDAAKASYRENAKNNHHTKKTYGKKKDSQ